MRFLLRSHFAVSVGAVIIILLILVVAQRARSPRNFTNQEHQRKPIDSSNGAKTLRPSSSTGASRLSQSEPDTQVVSEEAQAAREIAPYKLGWNGKVTRARDNWGRLLSLETKPIDHDQAMKEVMRIMSLADETAKADALQKLLYGQRIKLQMTQFLLGLYDQQKAGDLRDVLFASMLFSSEESYISEQLLQRAYGQPADERQFQFLSLLPGNQEQIWRLLCDSVPQCTSESSAREATLAISSMVETYGIERGHRDFGSHMYALFRQIKWPSARKYVYHSLTRHPAPALYEHFNAAVSEETDEELKKYANELMGMYFKRR